MFDSEEIREFLVFYEYGLGDYYIFPLQGRRRRIFSLSCPDVFFYTLYFPIDYRVALVFLLLF